jgi:pimeloyl-ACP methyl ester carboxylesterase
MRGEFVDIGGARLYYYAAGSRGAGEPVVLLHGFATSGHLWSGVASMLPAGHRIVVVDLLGHGRSDRAGGRPLSIGAHGERIIALFDQLGIRSACVAGHDLGGGVAQWMAVRHPGRVSRMCLVDSVGFDDWPATILRAARLTRGLTGHLPPAWLLSALRGHLLRGYADRDRAVRSVELYTRPFSGAEGRDALMAQLGALDRRQTTGVGAELGETLAPTAVVWGQHDPFLPVALGRRLHRAIPHSTFDVIPGVRHFTPEEAPRQIADVLHNLLRR